MLVIALPATQITTHKLLRMARLYGDTLADFDHV